MMIPPCFSFHSQTRSQELLASEIMPRLLFLLAELALHHGLRGDARVVGPRKPEHLVPVMRARRARMS